MQALSHFDPTTVGEVLTDPAVRTAGVRIE